MTQSSAKRQTEDLMLSGKSFKNKEQDRFKTDPWGTPHNTGDNTGTGSKVSPYFHLMLLLFQSSVLCVQSPSIVPADKAANNVVVV